MKEFFKNLFGNKSAPPDVQNRAEPAAFMPSRQPEFEPYKKGDVIGGTYEVLGTLGKGGFGIVYLATQPGRRPTALKTFRDEFLADAGTRAAFQKEALIWVNLEEHPYILAADCVREFSGRLFVAMDYVAPDAEGRVTLQDHLRRGVPLALARTVEWGIQFCLAMEHANAHGIKCHRDIKPANILVSQDTVKISDFGLAAAAEIAWKHDMRREGSVVTGEAVNGFGLSILRTDGKACCGTPGYLPPEVFRGEGADVRSDIYSFGLVLWQMAMGSASPPFVGIFHGDIGAFMREAYERQMSGRVPSVTDPLRTVIERCLKPLPSNRYASFWEVRDALGSIFKKLTGRAFTSPDTGEQTAAFWNNKGMSLAALGHREEAVGCYDKALTIDPREPRIWSNKGLVLRELGRHGEALACYDNVLSIDPHLPGAWTNKAMCLAELGQDDDAIACYDKDIALDSRNAATWNNKGNSLNSLGRSTEAIRCFDKSLAIDPRYAEAWNNKGVALDALGRREEGISCYKKALAINPRYAETLYNMGISLAATGQREDAVACFESSLAIAPTDATVWFSMGNAHDALGQPENAIGCYDKAIAIDAQYAAAWNNKGGTLVSLQRYRDAIVCYDAALALEPRDPERWFNKAYAEDQIGSAVAAAKSYGRFLELAPTQYAEQIAYARRRIKELQNR